MMRARPFIGFEIHDTTIWEPSRVLPMIDVMEKWGYNALVLHQNDLLDECTQLALSSNYGVSDLRLKKVRNKTAWLNRLTERLAYTDAELFLEIKEPSFHDYAVELHPELLGASGQPDPQASPWATFCQRKVDDLLKRVPQLGGLIVNLSSPESRVSLPDHVAINRDPIDQATWFDAMIAAFREPLEAQGKQLWVRDFSYTLDMAEGVLAAVDRCGGSVGASVKITAHDYFPEFPENPVARSISAPIIFEFEALGEHMGWGVIPNCRVEEFAQRIEDTRDMRVAGALVRTSWEAIPGSNALDSLSAVNVYALPKLLEENRGPRDLILEWLASEYNFVGKRANQLAELLLRSWNIPVAAYWKGTVFPRHSCLPSSWQEGWLSMETSGMGRRDRKLEISKSDPRLTEAARDQLFAEKKAATKLAHELAREAAELTPFTPLELRQQISAFQHLPDFARQFELATQATFYAARGEFEQAQQMKSRLIEFADELEARRLPANARVLLDSDQIRLFCESLTSTTTRLSGPST